MTIEEDLKSLIKINSSMEGNVNSFMKTMKLSLGEQLLLSLQEGRTTLTCTSSSAYDSVKAFL